MDHWKQINYITEEKLPYIKTLLFGILFLLSIFLVFNNFLGEFINLRIRALIYLLLFGIWISYWLFNKFYLPKNKKNKVIYWKI